MKKFWLFMILSVFVTIAAACGNEAKGEQELQKKETAEEEVQAEQGVDVDKGLMNVEITLPKIFFEGEDTDTWIAQAKENGVKEVKQNDDGSLTYKMSKKEYNEMMKEVESSTLESIEEMKNSEDFPSIQDITHNKNFSEYTLVADQEAYENSFDGFAALGLGLTGMYHQVFSGTSAEKVKVTIHLENADTGEKFDTIVYPDDLEEEENAE
ncbi:hypothetical protein ACFSCZ_00130 [Siminovitchia sediminis]|uniref:Antigen I/II N-terminal domain-containing protein n=1 Tax=Siminovitchia sediminis TaxID=1274353 RepID=A0ABW4KDF8_9BACI